MVVKGVLFPLCIFWLRKTAKNNKIIGIFVVMAKFLPCFYINIVISEQKQITDDHH